MQWTVGVSKTLWKYFDDIEAETESEAREKALSMVDEGSMLDYNNGLVVEDCYVNKNEA